MFSKFATLCLSALIVLVFTAMSFSQEVIFEDNFDSYTAGQQLVCQNPIDWDTWNNNPCDAAQDPYVSDLYSYSGSNSIVTVQDNDLIRYHNDLTSGKWNISFMIYIPAGKSGYFNSMSVFTRPSNFQWAYEVGFDAGGTGRLFIDSVINFTWLENTWQPVQVVVDLYADEGQFWLNGAMIHSWQWTRGGSVNLQLAVTDFYGALPEQEMYVDDFVFTDLLEPFVDDFESYTVGGQLACQDSINWTTWNNLPCDPVEDAFITDNYAYSGTKSFVIVQDNDVIKPLGTKTSGVWDIGFMFYIPAGKGGYFNCLSDFFGSPQEWAMHTWFYSGGTGEFYAGSTTPIAFTYLHDVWQLVRIVVNLDTDWAECWIADVLVHSWQWTLGQIGTGGPLQLDAVDFYGDVANVEMYVDDFMFGQYPFVPVELTSFTANVNQSGHVVLNWSTASETNNQLFEVERKSEDGQYVKIGYVNGHGTTTEPQEYSYVDNTVETGTYFYRLKQIDFLGTYEYSDEIEVEVNGPLTFGLEQNYPNPFNPSTKIKYSVPETGSVKLSIYSVLGEEVAVLVDGIVQAGFYEVTFDASNLPSGTYVYKLQAGEFNQVKKMILLK